MLIYKGSSFWINYFQKRSIGPVLHPLDAFWHSPVGLQVVQVERLFAGAQDAGDGGTVAYSEADLHIDALCCPPVNVSGEEPVVLAGLKHVAYLVCPDGVEVLIIATHLLPLGSVCEEGAGGMDERGEAEEEVEGEAKMINAFTKTWHKLNFLFPSLPFCLSLFSYLLIPLPHSLFFLSSTLFFSVQGQPFITIRATHLEHTHTQQTILPG